MQVRRSFLSWGAFLICLGAVPLAVQLGVLSSAAATELLRLWPLILVGIGIGLLLRFTRFEALGGMLTSATVGLLFGVVLAGGFPGAATTCNSAQAAGPSVMHNGAFNGAAASLNLEITCGDVDVSRAPGQAWTVDVASSGNPTIESDPTSLRLRTPTGTTFIPFGSDRHEQWRVSLPTEQSLSVSMTMNAATARLGLGDGPVSNVDATFNASDVRLDLSSETSASTLLLDATLNASTVRLSLPTASTSAGLTANAATLELCVPESVGIRIQYQDTLSSNNFAAAGLIQSDKTWQSPGYETSNTRAEIRVTANVSTISLSRSGGCR